SRIHGENAIHRDLHSGNILYSQFNNAWYISDLGFCGPANKPLKSIYGNLPYIAPEILNGKGYTFKSDVYSIAMLIPKIVSGSPLEFKSLIEQCWDADPLKRPDIDTLYYIMDEMNLSYNQDKLNKNRSVKNFFKKKFNLFRLLKPKTNNKSEINEISNIETNYTSSRLFTSKVYQFENLPEPKSATEEEQEAFHSKPYNYNIPDNIEDINKSSSHTFEDNGKNNLSKVFNELQISSKNEEQDEFEIPYDTDKL
ncbi:kinase-like domain-containing protein, partial [Glomus cerebriforme]